ncbi:MAG: hypothetical protein KKD05_02705 [Candidatus Omnitrophica bacterium]|nr:hypothetical protein [Candidatus Omnitrophota bacterium]
MTKLCKLIKFFLVLYCIAAVFTVNNLIAQQLPELELTTDQTSESFINQDEETLVIATDQDTVYLESMLSSEQITDTYANAEMLNVEGAQEITAVYLGNGYTLSAVATILKNANFSLEDTFKGMINDLGQEGLPEIIGALLEAKFKSSDVFKIAINQVKLTNPELTDNQIIESILGTSVDPTILKGLMTEIFIEKISSESDAVKSDLVVSMIDSGFSLNEITTALSENGFSIDQIAQIYSLAGIDIGLTYDLLLNVQGAQESDVAGALVSSDYSKNEVFECIVGKLIGSNTTEQIAAIAMGPISPEGPTSEQLNNSIVLGGVLNSEQISNTEIISAFLSAGFNLENTAAVLNGMGIDIENVFTALLGAQGGQGVAEIAQALISNGFDVHTVFSLSTAELKSQVVGLNQIVQLLIGPIDNPDAALTKNQKNNSLLLLDVLTNDNDSLADITAAFTANGFSLVNTARVFKANSLDAQNSYSAFTSATDGDYAGVAIAMTYAGFNVSTVIDLAVSDLKAAQYSNADIMLMLINTVPEDKLPTSNQLNIAICVTKLLVAQGATLPEIGADLINQGFDLIDTAKIFKRAEIDIAQAFPVILSLHTKGLDVVCADLRSAGYKAEDIFSNAVTILQAQGQDTAAIINSLITPVDPEKAVSSVSLTNASVLIKYLISQGSQIQDIYQGLISVNFSLTSIAKVIKRTTVDLETVFADLLALDGTQDIGNVCEALINGGYNRNSVFQIAVGQLKSLNYSTAAIINSLIGNGYSGENLSGFQQSSAQSLFQVLSAEGAELVDICTGFVTSNLKLSDISAIIKKANIELMPAYNALLNAGNGQHQLEVINALNKTGYSLAILYLAIVPELQSQNYSVEQIISYFINYIPAEVLPDSQLANLYTLVYALSENNISTENICTAMRATGFVVGDTAKVLYRKIGNAADVYSLLTTNYGSDSLNTSAIAMINAGYSMGAVLNIAVAAYEQQNAAMPEIINLIVAGNPLNLKIKLSEKLMDIFTDKGNSVSSICQSLFNEGVDLTNIAGILKTRNTAFNDAYSILTNITPGHEIMDIAFALISSDYDNQLVVNAVVDNLINRGNDNTQIISMFLGNNSALGMSDARLNCAVSLIKRFSSGGTSLESICADLGAAGLTLTRILPLMSLAEISIENTFNALLSFNGGQEPVELAQTLITQTYKNKEVITALVSHLQAQNVGNDVNTIIATIVGAIDPDLGINGIQQGYACVLTDVLLEKGNSLESVVTGFLNHGITLDTTTVVLKQAGCETEETYTALMAVYTPQENEVASREVTGKMLSAGYNSFTLYSLAVKKLNEQGIRDESAIISLLIGPVNSENPEQLRNASKLSLVIKFNKAKLTAQNNQESFISLFNQGFDITQISKMLDEGGVTQEQVDATLKDNLNHIVKELTKSGLSPASIIKLLITQSNKSELIRPISEQLRRNDFSIWDVRSAFYTMVGGLFSTDWTLITQGLEDAKDYSLENTAEAQTINFMINSGQTLTEISQDFAAQGYQMSYVSKLFKTLAQPIDAIFLALENTKVVFNSNLLVNDTAASITLLKYYDHKQVFTCASQYYKQIGVSSEQIILKLMSSKVNVDSTSIAADSIIGEYFKGKANVQPQSFVLLINSGYSVTWIKNALLEKNFSLETIEAFIQDEDNFQAIYQGLRDKDMSPTNIAKNFDIKQSPAEYTVLLAENMIKDGLDVNEVSSILLKYDANSFRIQQGIKRGLAYI